MAYNWIYLKLNRKGQILYDNGEVVNVNWPTFKSFEAAEEFLEEQDIRATLV